MGDTVDEMLGRYGYPPDGVPSDWYEAAPWEDDIEAEYLNDAPLEDIQRHLRKKSMANVSKVMPKRKGLKKPVGKPTKKPGLKKFTNPGKGKSSSGSLSLPQEANVPPSSLSESVLFFYGRKSIGKTTLATNFEGSFTFMFERGRRNLKIRMVPKPNESELDWEIFLEYLELALADKSIKTIVIDTIDRMYECVFEYICKQAKCKHPNDKNDYGATWTEIKTTFEAVIAMIHQSGKGVILLSHEKPKPLIKLTKGLKRSSDDADAAATALARMEPSCSGQAFDVIQEMCDFVLYLSYVGEDRACTVRSPSDYCWTACGVEDVFCDPKGNPINAFKLGNTPALAFKALNDAYNNKLYDINYEEPVEVPMRRKGVKTAKKKFRRK